MAKGTVRKFKSTARENLEGFRNGFNRGRVSKQEEPAEYQAQYPDWDYPEEILEETSEG